MSDSPKYERCYFCANKAEYNDIVFGEMISVCKKHFSFSNFTS